MSESRSEAAPSADVSYTLALFADDVRAVLTPFGIAMRLDEDADGTRTIQAWPAGAPEAVATFAIDDLPIAPEQAHSLGTHIRRSFQAGSPTADM